MSPTDTADLMDPGTLPPLNLADIEAWLEAQDAATTFVTCASGGCLVARYLVDRNPGLAHVAVTYDRYSVFDQAQIVANGDWDRPVTVPIPVAVLIHAFDGLDPSHRSPDDDDDPDEVEAEHCLVPAPEALALLRVVRLRLERDGG